MILQTAFRRALVFVVSAVAMVRLGVAGEMLYTTDGSNLVKVNLDTGGATVVGALGVANITALTLDSDGTLWAIFGATNATLGTVNRQTGQATLVTGLPTLNARVTGLDAAPDGTLVAVTGGLVQTLYNVNKATGAFTLFDYIDGFDIQFKDIAARAATDVAYVGLVNLPPVISTFGGFNGPGITFDDSVDTDLAGIFFNSDGALMAYSSGPNSTLYEFVNGNLSAVDVLSNTMAIQFGDTVVEESEAPGQIEDLKESVADLIALGAMLPADGNSLLAKLNAALAALDGGDTATAISKLVAFQNQVRAFVRTGRLSASDGQALIDAAQAIIDGLS